MTVLLGACLHNTRRRRAKLGSERREVLADLGLDWAR
ncbi:helicase [Streptomyces sp. NPDC007100]